MPNNTAAWIEAKKGKIVLKSAPYTHPHEGEIVVKNKAIAINPVDWIIQIAPASFNWIKYPFVLGSDIAGEVVEVGKNVARFKVGDRVIGHAVGADKDCNTPAQGAFQQYTVVLAHMAAEIPKSLAFESAAVLPLAISTAACGLFQKDHLGLDYPALNMKPNGKTLLIWGGSSSVGSNAIQLAVAAGYEVITTASPKNFDYVKVLGASQVFDYKSLTVIQDIISIIADKDFAGALAIGNGSARPCLDITHASKGNKFVSIASPSVSLAGGMTFKVIAKFVSSMVSQQIIARSRRIKTKMIYGTTLKNNEVSKLIYEDYLPKALARGSYIAAPQAQVIGEGLRFVQNGLDIQRKGVSAKKIVIAL
jgi:NADPH:quinone reductase-like Zn-dependent oxidoreductase